MKKNVASQKIGAQMITASDGSAFTGSVTVYVCGDAGTQSIGSVGSGACTHEGNGYHTYAPAQAETNYDLIAFTFIGTGAIPATVQVFTGFPQTGDSYARLGAPAGASVSADIASVKTDSAAILLDTGTDGVVVASASKTGYSLTATTGLGNQTANITGNLSGSVGSVTGAVGSVTSGVTVTTNNDKTGYSLTATTGLGNQTANITGNLSGSVGSVTGAVGSVTGNVGGNVTGSVGSISGVTFPTNFGDLAVTVTTGQVTVGTNNDKTGYSISGTKTTLDALNDVSAAQVNAEVVDALVTDTYAEPGQGTPAATASLKDKISYIYKFLRNKVTTTSTTVSVYDDAGTTVDQKSTISDDGSTFTRGEYASGP